MAHQQAAELGTAAPPPRVAVETNGINLIARSERRGTPRQLSWRDHAEADLPDLGVLVALAVRFLGTLALCRTAVRRHEAA